MVCSPLPATATDRHDNTYNVWTQGSRDSLVVGPTILIVANIRDEMRQSIWTVGFVPMNLQLTTPIGPFRGELERQFFDGMFSQRGLDQFFPSGQTRPRAVTTGHGIETLTHLPDGNGDGIVGNGREQPSDTRMICFDQKYIIRAKNMLQNIISDVAEGRHVLLPFGYGLVK